MNIEFTFYEALVVPLPVIHIVSVDEFAKGVRAWPHHFLVNLNHNFLILLYLTSWLINFLRSFIPFFSISIRLFTRIIQITIFLIILSFLKPIKIFLLFFNNLLTLRLHLLLLINLFILIQIELIHEIKSKIYCFVYFLL